MLNPLGFLIVIGKVSELAVGRLRMEESPPSMMGHGEGNSSLPTQPCQLKKCSSDQHFLLIKYGPRSDYFAQLLTRLDVA